MLQHFVYSYACLILLMYCSFVAFFRTCCFFVFFRALFLVCFALTFLVAIFGLCCLFMLRLTVQWFCLWLFAVTVRWFQWNVSGPAG